ncbi:MAG: deoxyribodipyrimidine photolyase [Micavibrio sp.]|nr:deoxyribodipyrimidine photolyase [Micavibrio sp.]
MNEPIIVWFRQDLRLADNPALHAAASEGKILPIYILDDTNAGTWKMGAANRVWTHHSLIDLNTQLNGKLCILKGDAKKLVPQLIKETKAKAIYWNRCYEPWRISRDKKIKENLEIECKSFNGSLLWEPWHIKTQADTPYKVFTPYYRKGCLNHTAPREPLGKPDKIDIYSHQGLSINDLNLLPPKEEGGWGQKMTSYWDISEKSGHQRLTDFLEDGLNDYKEGRNIPSQNNVSRLSPYLHHGQISPHQAWYQSAFIAEHNKIPQKDLDHFHSELGWREFSYHLLYHFPDITHEPLQENFKDFPWHPDKSTLEAWKKGQTGYPIIDAAMRELWATGYMHGRCRMIVGSFLVKNMLVHWHEGEQWFWDCLVDADLANNSASWQWIAGCGADAAPYFRVFNPLLQSKKFDGNGDYIRQWVPELSKLSDKDIHEPWTLDENTLKKADIVLGNDYPKPILDLSATRNRALDAYATIKKKNNNDE